MNVSFTGHRPHKLWGYDIHQDKYRRLYVALRTIVMENIEREQENTLISGMALGVDTVAAYLAVALRDKGLPIKFEAAVPCWNQDSKWHGESREIYKNLVSKADVVTVVHEGPYNYTCMQRRNEYMVDKANVLVAVWDGSPGGTSNCVHYAEKKGVRIIRVDPRSI